jgi:serine/threonine protein kinase
MAPEYIGKGKISTKADIYSLGVVIIEIITGCKVDPDIDLDIEQVRNCSFAHSMYLTVHFNYLFCFTTA